MIRHVAVSNPLDGYLVGVGFKYLLDESSFVGPALVALGAGYKEAFIFVIAMIVGMYIHDRLFKACLK